jgi:hypothetical protein
MKFGANRKFDRFSKSKFAVMKNTLFLVAGFFLMALTSCKVIGTLHPLSEDEKDFVAKTGFIGTWADPKDKSGYCQIDTIANTSGKLYSLRLVSSTENKGTDTSEMYAHLIQLSHNYYVDCWYNSGNLDKNIKEAIEFWTVPRHFFFKISFIDKNNIETSTPDDDELLKLVKAKKINLNILKLKEDDYLVLNPSSELKKQIVELEKYKQQVYKDKSRLTRSK